ncbi:hypothetical protein C8R46DRAFT_1124950 [Mycena filopes]|nr:hypothetical protein C8R46DRAFT_1124950 [Mycena filopes]
MHFPALQHLRTTAEEAIAKLGSRSSLTGPIAEDFEDARNRIAHSSIQSQQVLMRKFGNGRPQFALAVLVGLRGILPERYQTRTYLLGLLSTFTAQSSLSNIAQYLQIRRREDLSNDSLFLFTAGVLFTEIYWGDQTKLQTAVDTLLTEVYADIRRACVLLTMREKVFESIDTTVPDALSTCSPSRPPGPFEHTPRLLLENLRRSSIGVSREDLLKFKCGSWNDEYVPVNKKRRRSGAGGNGNQNKRVKGANGPDPSSSPTEHKARDGYVQREIRRNSKRTQGSHSVAPKKSGSAEDACTSSTKVLYSTHGIPPIEFENVKRPYGKPLTVLLPKSDAYPNTLDSEVAVAIDRLILAPPVDLYDRHFYFKMPPMSPYHWQTIPVDNVKKCEGLLVIGKYIIEASMVELVHKQRSPWLDTMPATAELVLSRLLSHRTFRTVLIQAGVIRPLDPVPSHLAAHAFMVYLGALFTTGTLPFSGINERLCHVFKPVAEWLKSEGLGEYQENRAALAAVGINPGAQ